MLRRGDKQGLLRPFCDGNLVLCEQRCQETLSFLSCRLFAFPPAGWLQQRLLNPRFWSDVMDFVRDLAFLNQTHKLCFAFTLLCCTPREVIVIEDLQPFDIARVLIMGEGSCRLSLASCHIPR